MKNDEALKGIIKYGFSFDSVNKVWAEHKTLNIPSGKVMEKVGMSHEGIMRKHYKQKEGEYLDMSVKSILREEFQSGRKTRKIARAAFL